jgi:hypothetical protein
VFLLLRRGSGFELLGITIGVGQSLLGSYLSISQEAAMGSKKRGVTAGTFSWPGTVGGAQVLSVASLDDGGVTVGEDVLS